MHIVLVNRWYPPYTGFGGVAAYNYYLGHALGKLGQQVTVVASRQNPSDPAIQQDGMLTVHRLLMKEHYYLGRLPVLGRYARPLLQYAYSRQVSQFLKNLYKLEPFDIVEFAEINAEGYAYLKELHRPPVVVRCHTPTFVLKHYYHPEEMPYDTSLTSQMEKACIHRADKLSAPSHDMARTIALECGLDEKQIAVIPNPIDTHLFSPAVPRLPKQSGDPLTILHVGRLERVKGIETLAQAIPQVVREFPNTRFVFIGDDRPDGQGSTWKQRLEAFFTEQGVVENVVMAGGVDQAALIRWYRRADIAVVPSMLYESFSYTCVQAMSAGLPVVASRIGGIPETIGDCGLIVEPGNADKFSQELVGLISNPHLRKHLGRKSMLRARELFDSRIVVGTMLSFYRQVST
jgi:glycogen(starch) synthase